MLISKKWLQTYFDTELPSAQKIADTLLLHSFEIEGLSEINGDQIIDIDVLPNRAHDCLSYEGVAKELSGLLDISLRDVRYGSVPEQNNSRKDIVVSVHILNQDQCTRYATSLVENIEIKESPEWLKNRLKSMGQKTINNLVDATNYVMFDMGQPMHVFDADKVVGGITVRNAELGETMTTLSGEELDLLETDLVIADDKGILALAGVKGGVRAEVTVDTKNIIIESAHFNPITTRKTARRVKIFTDSSKRFENGITAEKVFPALKAMRSLVYELASTDETVFSDITDVYPNIEQEFQLTFTREHTARLLGFDISNEDIKNVLKKMNYQFISNNNESYTVLIPFERIDLRIPEDMIEEIGRIYGYHMIPVKSLDDVYFEPEINNIFYSSHVLRNYFVENGFTEIMNYSFVNKGNVEMFNPIASDKKALRKNLWAQMKDSLEKNARVADFVHIEQVLNFEIDNIHIKEGEETWCCFGINTLSKKSRKKYGTEEDQINTIISDIESMFAINNLNYQKEENTISFKLNQCVQGNIDQYNDVLKLKTYGENTLFKGISVYPYIKRDISFWADSHDIKTFKDAISNAGAKFLQKVNLFDIFEKDGKNSYAFSMIFQSFDKTLTDEEVDVDMDLVNKALDDLDVEIR